MIKNVISAILFIIHIFLQTVGLAPIEVKLRPSRREFILSSFFPIGGLHHGIPFLQLRISQSQSFQRSGLFLKEKKWGERKNFWSSLIDRIIEALIHEILQSDKWNSTVIPNNWESKSLKMNTHSLWQGLWQNVLF